MTAAAPAAPAASEAGELVRRVLARTAPPVDLRAGGAWAAIQEALREDDASVPRGIWERPLKAADPGLAAALAAEALETGGPDLQVAGWLAQAWTMTGGFAGARAGLEVIEGLCAGGWDALHGADDPAALERPFAWMAVHLPAALARVEVTRDPAGGAGFTWAQREAALHRQRVQAAAGERPAPGEATPGDVEQAAGRTPPHVHQAAARELQAVTDATERLQALLRDRWHGAPPSLRALHRRAAEIRAWAEERLATSAPAPTVHASAPEDIEDLHAAMDAPADGPYEAPWPAYAPSIGSREEAYALLDAAAGYLAAAEPHSPAPWLVRRAVGWGGMELRELLESLIGEGYDLKSLRLLLGLAGEGRP